VAVVAEALAARDQSDRTRSVSPLSMAPDALYIDTTSLTVEDVVARALAAAERQKLEGRNQN
jgi:cytidylate kinase